MSNHQQGHLPESFWSRLRHKILGPARDVYDPRLGHNISLIAFLAWIGLGTDGLSSSAYGPEEAYRTLGGHIYFAPYLVLITTITIFIISYTYSKIIEHFPEGGGGYIVATKLLGDSSGVVSGSALLVDYVLTITVSIAAGGDAVFSLLPIGAGVFKIPVEYGAILFLMVMNLRGAKESVTTLIPIFMTFIVTHFILLFFGIGFHLSDFSALAQSTRAGMSQGIATMGVFGVFLLLTRAYSMGAGTYTGIEAVSNGLEILREPKAKTGKKTMAYMALSLAITAGGLLFCYMLWHVQPVAGRTLNAVLVDRFAGGFRLWGLPVGNAFVWVTIFSEAILLFVAAQTGFIGGPRVMANMALDSWLPRRYASLSDRLTTQRGVVLMSLAAMATLAYTKGDVRVLVVMYSINVFVSFSMSQVGMCRFWTQKKKALGSKAPWIRNFLLHAFGFVLCAGILVIMLAEKFMEGGWITVAVTFALILLCRWIRGHYRAVSKLVEEIGETFKDIPMEPSVKGGTPKVDPNLPTAVILVGGGHSRMGVHTLFTIFRLFPNTFRNVIFLSVGVINSEFFKGEEGVSGMEQKVKESLQYYVKLARGLGIPADYSYRVGTDVVNEAAELCVQISKEYASCVFFGSELVFQEPRWYHRLLHNETAYAIQRRLRFAGLSIVILPVLLFEKPEKRQEQISEMLIYRGVRHASSD